MPSFHFKGKTFLQNYHHTVKFHNLVAEKNKGLTKSPSLDDNLIIHGDNLKALKALLPTHAGKIKCIYIDPPYNTGNENWVYNDNVASPMIQEWLGKVVGHDDLTRHDKWCCMMYPRLCLLRELLKDDGVIFISIDDNELYHLQMIMDEIFGEENFIGLFVINSSPSAIDYGHIATMNDYALFYAKDITKTETWQLPEKDKSFKYSDEIGGFNLYPLYNGNVAFNPKTRPNLYYPFYLNLKKKIGANFFEIGLEKKNGWIEIFPVISRKDNIPRVWRWGKDKSRTQLNKEIVGYKTEDGEWRVVQKTRHAGKVIRSMQLDTEVSSRRGTGEVEEIFGKKVFSFPKPTELIKRFILISSENNDVILDSFAGSGTTGHAVLALNKEDGGNRKFILIECEDYADKITAERMRRVIKGVPTASDEVIKAGLGGSFSFFELGDEINMDHLLEGKKLPSYEDLAKYAFFTATGEKFDPNKVDEKSFRIGSSSTFEVFLMYSPDKKKLKEMALNLDFAEKLHKQFPTRQKLVFAPACFMEDYSLKEFNIRFAQLPFEIYRMAE